MVLVVQQYPSLTYSYMILFFFSMPQPKGGTGKVAIHDDSSMAESTGGDTNLLDSQSPKVGQTATTKHQGLITVKVGAIFLYNWCDN